MSDPTHSAPRREPVLLRVRAHARRLVLPAVLVVAGAGAAGFWGGALPEPWMNVAVWAGFALLVLGGIGAWLRWVMRRTVVTPSRVIMHRGVLVQHRSDLPFAQVREVRTRRSLLQQVFRSGNVVLVTGAPAPTVLRDVPNSDQVCDALRELIDRHYAASLDATATPVSHGFAQMVGGASGVGPGAEARFTPERPIMASGITNQVSTRQTPAGSDTVRVSDAPRPGFSGGRFTRAQ